MSASLGNLAPVELRTVWASEATGFTPWLGRPENLKQLGEALHLPLELEAQEKEVGPFRADLLCRDDDGHWVLIENQLERTDHTHLGQLLTYAAGLQAVSIVWIASKFAEEHRAALDWLNEVTDERINFFGVEIELWRIGDSKVAPKFNVVCQPNNWTKSVQSGVKSSGHTENRQLQIDFWTGYGAALEGSPVLHPRAPQPRAWMPHPIGRTGFHLSAIATFWESEAEKWGGELRAELHIQTHTPKAYFALLEAEREAIEKELGMVLLWHNPEEGRRSKIFIRKSVDLTNRGQWPEYFRWLRGNLEAFHRVFADRVRRLKLDGGGVEVG